MNQYIVKSGSRYTVITDRVNIVASLVADLFKK